MDLSGQDDDIRELLDRKLEQMVKHMRDDEAERGQAVAKNPIMEMASCEPITVTDENFEGIVAAEKPVVIDFWAQWCGPCRMIGPVISELAQQYCGKVTFGKLNVDENPMTPSRFGIFSIPTLLFFSGGVLRERILGAVPKGQIERTISTMI